MFESPSTQSSSKSKHFWRLPAFISLVLMVLLLVWDFSGGDMKMAALWGETTGFPLRTNWWMVKVMHEGARTLGWIFLLAMLIGIWRPWGALRSLATAERALLFLSVVCALLSVVLIKGFSHTSCPWDLQDFGGAAPYVSHWDFWQRDGAGGHCLHSWPPTLGSSKTTRQLRALGYWAPCRLVLCWAFHSKYGVLTL